MLVGVTMGDLEWRARQVDRQFGLLARVFTPRTVFMDVGAEDCSLALRASGWVERVYALDMRQASFAGALAPCNLKLMPPPEGAVDVAFSERFAENRLHDIYRSLVRGGIYVTGYADGIRRRLLDAGFSKVRLRPFGFPRRFVSHVTAVK